MKKKKMEMLSRINLASRAALALPAGRDLRLERPCRVKRFLALAAKWPDWPDEASAEGEEGEEDRRGEKQQVNSGRKEGRKVVDVHC